MLEVDLKSKVFVSANDEQLEAVRDLYFTVPPQHFTCIVGPSGCGKTSTLRIILGLDEDFRGNVTVQGQGRTAAVFQEPRLLPWRTVEQNVTLGMPPHLLKSDLSGLFTELGLNEMRHFYPSELSLGLARRVALARAFATEPELLILDEPFVSLDDNTAARLRNLLMAVWRARPTTVLMVTHNKREAAELADTVLLLSDRPARVIGQVPIDKARGQRNKEFVNSVVDQMDSVGLPDRSGAQQPGTES